MREVIINSILQEFDQETPFLKSGLGSHGVGIAMKFCTRVAKAIKLKVKKFWGLVPSFVEVIGKKLIGGTFLPFCPEQTPWTIQIESNVRNRTNRIHNSPFKKL